MPDQRITACAGSELRSGAVLGAVKACLAGIMPACGAGFLVDVWDGEKGLPNSSVTSITQTPDGYLWVGTYNGLARFEGVHFEVFDPVNTAALPHPRIHELWLDATGTMWIKPMTAAW